MDLDDLGKTRLTIERARDMASHAHSSLRSVSYGIFVGLLMLMTTPMLVAGAVKSPAVGIVLVLAAYTFELVTIVAIGRRASIVEETHPDCTSPWEARGILATVYALGPLALLLAKDWFVHDKPLEAMGAFAVALALLVRLAWLLRELRVPDAAR